MQLDEALTSRDTINTHLREILDDATDKWGVKVVRVEIQRIDPPPDVMHSMHEQMKAERQRRALVTTADGDREAAIARAQGHQQSAILQAEGVKQQQVLEALGKADATRALADAERYRQEAIAAGQAAAIKLVYDAIHAGNPTPDLLAVKYLEAMAQIANGQATKIFLPADAAGLMGSLAGVAELFKDGPAPSVAANGAGTGNGQADGAVPSLPPPPAAS
jgi:regulator of protease activity HflC (stomatin/prohibitin superfamily)